MPNVVRHRSETLALVGLLTVAVTWGTTFPLSKALFSHITVWDLLATRFGVAALVMVGCFFRAVRRLPRRSVTIAAALGVTYGGAQILANLGLDRTPAGVAGFITGTYVVLTPLCAALIVRTRLGSRAWWGAGIAGVGLGLLALRGFSIGVGEALTLSAALLYALHIVLLGTCSTARNAVGLAVVQIVSTSVVCGIAAVAVQGRITLPSRSADWAVLTYMALVSGALAMIMQSWAQAHLTSSRVALTMATEPVWAAGLSVVALGEPLTWRLCVGGGLIVTALVLAETGGPRRELTRSPHVLSPD